MQSFVTRQVAGSYRVRQGRCLPERLAQSLPGDRVDRTGRIPKQGDVPPDYRLRTAVAVIAPRPLLDIGAPAR